jgi:hypothetical protein
MDEFNRIDIEVRISIIAHTLGCLRAFHPKVLSVVAQQLLQIRRALIEELGVFDFQVRSRCSTIYVPFISALSISTRRQLLFLCVYLV